MNQRLAAAQAALDAGRPTEAVGLLASAIEADPAQPPVAYRVLAVELHRMGRSEEAASYAARGLERHPNDFALWNLRGVALRRLKRVPEAVTALEQAHRLDPANVGVCNNLGNALMDLGEPARAEVLFAELVRTEPESPELLRQLARALLQQAKDEPAMAHLAHAVELKPGLVAAWLDLVGRLNDAHRTDEALALLDRATAANPDAEPLLRARGTVLRRGGRLKDAQAYLEQLLPAHPDAAWLHFQLGVVLVGSERERAVVHARRAVELEPHALDHVMLLIDGLERGDSAGVAEAYELAVGILPRRSEFSAENLTAILRVFMRVFAFEDAAKLADFKTLGRLWVNADMHWALLLQLPRIGGDEDRYELLEQHRLWGRRAEDLAAVDPIVHPRPRAPGGPIRLGFMSSDLRNHPVGYFTEPLFDHVDNGRFELFVYSYYEGEEDEFQASIARKTTGYRWWPEIEPKDAAQAIADDGLDLLIDLGGSTLMNKVEVMAYRPAPLQASWLGYPHSAGLSTIDYLIVDPYLRPERDDLLLETPLVMPSSWIALGGRAFPERHVIDPGSPHARRGFITFGTANNSYKYTPQAFDAWARVMAAVPSSRFLFVRPEAGARIFRTNVIRHFAARGIEAGRIEFAARGSHMAHYNLIDIALDTFPQTGGTTTCEALWMGVPTVSLVGPTIYERLSYSILSNAGLPDLCARSVDDYVETAVKLANDRARIADIRANQRARLKASPLGRTEDFARDFYDLIERAVTGAIPAAVRSR